MAQGRNLVIDIVNAPAPSYLPTDPVISTLEDLTLISGAMLIVCITTQYLSVNWMSLSTFFCSASVSNTIANESQGIRQAHSDPPPWSTKI